MLVRKCNPMLSALVGGGLSLLTGRSFADYGLDMTQGVTRSGHLALAGPDGADYGLNMTQGATSISHQVYDLHMLIFWICVAIGAVVFGVMFISMLKHRKSQGAVAAQFHENTTVEIIWTVIPFLILIAMAIPATKTLLAMADTRDADLTIKVTGFQWKWRYDYMGGKGYEDSKFGYFSVLATPRDQIENKAIKDEHYLLEVDHPLVVPVGKKIRFLTTANDVIHSWWVPALAIKSDAIPGFINESWAKIDEPGIYRGQCAELCGKDHGFMPIVVEAKSEEDYKSWAQEQKAAALASAEDPNKVWTKEELIAKGEQVYTANCAACHQPNGGGIPGIFPALKGGVITTGPVADHLNRVIHGKPGTAMAAFGPQMSDSELAAVITYERHSWGNDTGDIVQPPQVKAAR
jgi:cytochrome c oxidase subunit 2